MSNACVINATHNSGQLAGSPIAIEAGGDVVLKAFGKGTGAWSVTLAFAPSTSESPVTLTISNGPGRDRAQTSVMSTGATQWVGWVQSFSGEFEVSGIVCGDQPDEALAGDLGVFVPGTAPTKAIKAGATYRDTSGTQYTYSAGAMAGWEVAAARHISGPVRVGYFGPSTADNYAGVCDMLSTYSAYPGSGFTTYNVMAPGKMEAASYPGRLLVACGGVSGETITQSYNRFLATYSASRKAATDVINTRPHVVVYRSCAINDIQGYSSTASDAEINAKVAIEVAIIKHFARTGVSVVFSGPMGYSAAVSGALLAVRRDAVVRYLAAYKATLVGLNNVRYIDAIGLSCAVDGSMLSTAISSDGIHLTDVGGYRFGVAEARGADSMVRGTPFYGMGLFDSMKALGNNDGTLAITHSGGNSASGTAYTAEECTFNLTSAIGGSTTAAFLSAGLASVFQASTAYVIAFDVEIKNADGSVRAYDDRIKILFRCLFRNASGADVLFDQTPIYRAGKFIFPVVVPSVAPTLVQIFAQLQTSRVETVSVSIRPVGVFAASAAMIQ